MCSADQIKVPNEIDDVVREYTKAAVRAQPEDLIDWSRQWFEARAEESRAAAEMGKES